MVFSCPLHKRRRPAGQEEAAAPASGRLGNAVRHLGTFG